MPNKIDHRKSKSVNYVNKKATPNDKFLSKDRKEKDNQLKTNQGWHDHKPKIPADARSYWSVKEENHEADVLETGQLLPSSHVWNDRPSFNRKIL